jgi:hypothetical protein
VRRKLTKPAAIVTFVLLAAIYFIGDDVGALVDQATHAFWLFSTPDQRPTGTWRGEFMGRTITLHLEPDFLSDEDSAKRHGIKNGFLFKRLEWPRGIRTVQGTLTVDLPDGKFDEFKTWGSPNMHGTHVVLSVHKADGVAGIMIEKADVTFAPPHAVASLRYRIPGAPGNGGYIKGGVLWTAVPGPGVVTLERDGLQERPSL